MAKKAQLSYKEIEDRLRRNLPQPHPRPTPASWPHPRPTPASWPFQRRGDEPACPAEEVGYRLLSAFGKGDREIARYKEGKGVIKTFDGLLVKGEFCYRGTTTLRLASVLEELKRDATVIKSAPKIIAVSDGKTIRAFDMRQRGTFEQQVSRLYCDFEFFYPLAGVERTLASLHQMCSPMPFSSSPSMHVT